MSAGVGDFDSSKQAVHCCHSSSLCVNRYLSSTYRELAAGNLCVNFFSMSTWVFIHHCYCCSSVALLCENILTEVHFVNSGFLCVNYSVMSPSFWTDIQKSSPTEFKSMHFMVHSSITSTRPLQSDRVIFVCHFHPSLKRACDKSDACISRLLLSVCSASFRLQLSRQDADPVHYHIQTTDQVR